MTQADTQDARAAIRWWMIVVAGAVVVLLSFGAAFLGARLAAPAEAEQTPVPTESLTPEVPTESPTPEAPTVLPAGADVRVGTGAPDLAYGAEGDVYIDLATANVYVRTASEWRAAGNIRTAAHENLTGEQGEQGAQGEQGEQGATGEQGAPGTDGTQVVLGVGTPGDPCEADGDVFIDTEGLIFYECVAGSWTPVAEDEAQQE